MQQKCVIKYAEKTTSIMVNTNCNEYSVKTPDDRH